MSNWTLNDEHLTSSKVKKIKKKHQAEVLSVFANLIILMEVLKKDLSFEKAVLDFNFLKSEKKNVYRIKEETEKNSHPVRLYFCVNNDELILFLLTIGDKNSQSTDIANAHKTAKKILSEK